VLLGTWRTEGLPENRSTEDVKSDRL